ncbi:hypothetical protein PT974_09761 [Cladobotryum mycophilum]|uniref:Short-chain dehydrogenase n=1 Tax=Cladobotryum mycophilum TaxID=491253 RepID=A0ABR0SH43_9HYPO
MAATKILLVLGAGKNIGQHIAQGFKAAGYKIALVSRSAADNETTPEGYLTLKGDLTQPSIYNAAAVSQPADQQNHFSIPIKDLDADLAVNHTSAYVAAGQAVAGFDTLPKDTPKVFIYTGNLLAAVTKPVPFFTSLGIGKSAASYWIGASSQLYKDKGYKFYFADERTETGDPVGNAISGPAAAEFYVELADDKKEVPWFATFVPGKGYVDFPDSKRS